MTVFNKVATEIFGELPPQKMRQVASEIEQYYFSKYKGPTEVPTRFRDFLPYCKIHAQPSYKLASIRPHQYQNDLANNLSGVANGHHHVLINSSRQMGTTTMLMLFQLWSALRTPLSDIHFATWNLNSAHEGLDRIRTVLPHLPLTFGEVASMTKSELKFTNGSRISGAAIGSNHIAGKRFSTIVIDNASMVGIHASRKQTLDDILHQAAVYNTRVVIASQPGYVGEFFHKLWADPETDIGGKSRLQFAKVVLNWRSNPLQNTGWAASHRANLPTSQYRQEFENEFIYKTA
jgi:hypothetical protein